MANVGVPSGGPQYPSRQELGAQLRPYFEEAKQFGANRGGQRYNELDTIYQSINDAAYDPDLGPVTTSPYGDESPVTFTDVPTSSTNYSRPRTVAAGYNAATETVTVVFRDGTFYNYYGVSEQEWLGFSASFSKGKNWLNHKNSKQASEGLFIGKQRGVADVSSIPAAIQEQLYRVARTQQIKQTPRESRFTPGKVAGWQARTPGTNPSRGGKNPARTRKP